MIIYPPCSLTAHYPILLRIPPEERLAWVEQAENGIELTDEQNARLGFGSACSGGVLLPNPTAAIFTTAQKQIVVADGRALDVILQLGMRRAESRGQR